MSWTPELAKQAYKSKESHSVYYRQKTFKNINVWYSFTDASNSSYIITKHLLGAGESLHKKLKTGFIRLIVTSTDGFCTDWPYKVYGVNVFVNGYKIGSEPSDPIRCEEHHAADKDTPKVDQHTPRYDQKAVAPFKVRSLNWEDASLGWQGNLLLVFTRDRLMYFWDSTARIRILWCRLFHSKTRKTYGSASAGQYLWFPITCDCGCRYEIRKPHGTKTPW